MPAVKSILAWFLRRRGWKFIGEVPDYQRIVAVGAPHTSNLDFFVFLAALHEYRLKVSFIGKHTLFRWPLGYLMRRWGGIPVDRDAPGGIVDQVAGAMRRSDRVVLVVAPEGTRSGSPAWKDGFIRIARSADAVIMLVGVDFGERKVVIGPTVVDPADRETVMTTVRSFYMPFQGRKPGNQGPIRLDDEASGLLG